ncbi:MAG: 1,4-alpha-glucan branching protein GlgB [Acidimicrobiales bacterium]
MSTPTDPAAPRPSAAGGVDPDALYLFNEGRQFQLYDHLGAHLLAGGAGGRFAVWAPNAEAVSVRHDGNGWTAGADVLQPQGDSGVWSGQVDGVPVGTRYKYHIVSRSGAVGDKADPLAFGTEQPPLSASVLTDLSYAWGDGSWMRQRPARQLAGEPVSFYEVHLGSWRRHPDGRFMSYAELAEPLADHVLQHGFSHVELLPVMEHPYYGSWGYQTTGYFAPTARFGHPTEFMAFVDHLHQRGIGVILDWVPSHFATDAFALGEFDGTRLYEHEDARHRIHPDWGSYEFNYSRHEVRSFLISSAWFWLDRYHADGLRVDAVASMLYLDYSRAKGQWVPNRYGGRENLDAVSFLRQCNESAHEHFPGVVTIAEESTAWPGVSRPVSDGGLGFSMKWDMGWMHDTLQHLERDPVHRHYHYHELTFRALYAFTERFVLPLSHDEVVHGKGSLAMKMPGDDWRKLANLRLLFALQWLQPGKKLLFMGCEFATWREWSHEDELDWGLLGHLDHAGIAHLVGDLNRLYREQEALQADFEPAGFRWIIADDVSNDVLAWCRSVPGRAAEEGHDVLAVFNLTPVIREGYRLGVPAAGEWLELCNTDATSYGGSGSGNLGKVQAAPIPAHGYAASLELVLPPLGAVVLGQTGAGGAADGAKSAPAVTATP